MNIPAFEQSQLEEYEREWPCVKQMMLGLYETVFIINEKESIWWEIANAILYPNTYTYIEWCEKTRGFNSGWRTPTELVIYEIQGFIQDYEGWKEYCEYHKRTDKI